MLTDGYHDDQLLRVIERVGTAYVRHVASEECGPGEFALTVTGWGGLYRLNTATGETHQLERHAGFSYWSRVLEVEDMTHGATVGTREGGEQQS